MVSIEGLLSCLVLVVGVEPIWHPVAASQIAERSGEYGPCDLRGKHVVRAVMFCPCYRAWLSPVGPCQPPALCLMEGLKRRASWRAPGLL